jgi:hypothetical protein
MPDRLGRPGPNPAAIGARPARPSSPLFGRPGTALDPESNGDQSPGQGMSLLPYFINAGFARSRREVLSGHGIPGNRIWCGIRD